MPPAILLPLSLKTLRLTTFSREAWGKVEPRVRRARVRCARPLNVGALFIKEMNREFARALQSWAKKRSIPLSFCILVKPNTGHEICGIKRLPIDALPLLCRLMNGLLLTGHLFGHWA